LAELSRQSSLPDLIVIVDSSKAPENKLPGEFPALPIIYCPFQPPSASAQRNHGIALVPEEIGLVGFLDDDITFAEGSVAAMRSFWTSAPLEVGGAAFNMLNPQTTSVNWLKRTRLAKWIGLYAPEGGRVMKSGWQTTVGAVTADLECEWLPSTASVWRRKVLGSSAFDKFYEGYSYLEDLDFSYGVYKRGAKLWIIAKAGYYHWPSPAGRPSHFHFGRTEVRNRLYLVKKYRLSLFHCLTGIFIRWLMSISSGLRFLQAGPLQRAAGNVLAIAQWLLHLGCHD
jgi:GT2 family glycosyltransferase